MSRRSGITWRKSIPWTKRALTQRKATERQSSNTSAAPSATSSVCRWRKRRAPFARLELRRRASGTINSLLGYSRAGAITDLELVSIRVFEEHCVVARAVFDAKLGTLNILRPGLANHFG